MSEHRQFSHFIGDHPPELNAAAILDDLSASTPVFLALQLLLSHYDRYRREKSGSGCSAACDRNCWRVSVLRFLLRRAVIQGCLGNQ